MTGDIAVSPDPILELGQAFWKAKVLLSAVELDLFSALAADGPSTLEEIGARVGLHPRGARDFLDALVALQLLQRDEAGRYANRPGTERFLDRRKTSYVGGYLRMCNARLYPAWAHLTEALRTGVPVGAHHEPGADSPFERLYHDDSGRNTFLAGMTGGARPIVAAIASLFPWHASRRVVDVGCAEGCLLVDLLQAYPHLTAIGFDLAPVADAFARFVTAHGVSDRARFQPGDLRTDPFPEADVVVLGRVLHNWDLATKRRILAKAYDALPRSGTILIYERLIDNERRRNVMALLGSLNMLVVTPGGFDFTAADCASWLGEAGFSDIRVTPLVSAHTMMTAIRP